jgi:hypothetical protein
MKLKKCQDCPKILPPIELFSYVDSSNEAITKHSPEVCKECYEKRYGKEVKCSTPTIKDLFREIPT